MERSTSARYGGPASHSRAGVLGLLRRAAPGGLLSDSIERGIISANGPNERIRMVYERLKMADIGNIFSACEEGRSSGGSWRAPSGARPSTPGLLYASTKSIFGKSSELGIAGPGGTC